MLGDTNGLHGFVYQVNKIRNRTDIKRFFWVCPPSFVGSYSSTHHTNGDNLPCVKNLGEFPGAAYNVTARGNALRPFSPTRSGFSTGSNATEERRAAILAR